MPLEGLELYFRYPGGAWLFMGASIRVEEGEMVGLIGPSGSGKSTLARLLSGYLQPVRGSVLVDGVPLSKKGFCPVQMVLQHPEKAVNPRWKLRKILEESWSPGRAEMEQLGIDPAWLDRFPSELSAGELQRVCLARALNPATRYLVADEMTTMLDPITQAQIWHVVAERVRVRGMGVLVVTHDIQLASRLCDRVIHIDELRKENKCVDMMSGRGANQEEGTPLL